ncbi:beta-1,4-mannosyl-glycoprotein 4-beta-N-acetylglucosaminyltransferase isoform X2 [Kryptolebias marmoratus]|nr:beta-1,4-mannosyl-glycoprotein 4-beta-N-acetylglucosaminyltransferase isoform X2 [Kryptolebias marmoratus]XP_024860079.1 beta-1,4-mannosyl-glycoprotein 4-beta-N-acetylglucosaminyltransferase isoform X2 [Kryptolebias marmoratus]XP_024860083.1 beta-1,4-mannosyl-glycoprotein 4-beta-N-acetylglucosaminyltransferase isoform X2 [Kryptolebias marmoratus]XP_037830681.1 beta-1,4-mannosyl-glycoprotein 4-beta-N-acetylglucosaminyltransferase isoform X2 [Kryptolebias marmoratus]
MKMRRHRVFLLCTVGLCVISFLHYYKALHYVSLLRELSAPYPNIKSFIMVSGFFWKEKGLAATPLSPASPEEEPVLRHLDPKLGGGGRGLDVERVLIERPGNHWENQEENEIGDMQKERGHENLNVQPFGPKLPEALIRGKNPKIILQRDDKIDLSISMGDIHTRIHELQDDKTPYFVHTKAGALCFRQGTEVATPKEYSAKIGEAERIGANDVEKVGQAAQRKPLELQQQPSMAPKAKARAKGSGKRLVKCVCRPGWHGPYCGVPTMVYHSNLPTKERLTPRKTPRRVINAINVNHEFDLLHVRFRELAQAVDLFIVCESNFTAYGEKRPLSFLRLLLNGTYDYVRHKILYVFLNHFPDGGRQDGWIADDYLRTFLTRNGMSRVRGARPDDVFVINDADEIPAQEGLLFLKLFDGWTEPFAIHMRKSLYGFFWKQFGSLEVISGCTLGMLHNVYDNDGIKLRRREYYTMPGFRKYENSTGHILVQWSVGSPFHYAGWHCSWCFTPEGIFFKLVSAQNGDFPRWGDYEDKRDLNYIRELIRTGGWFDGSVQEYPSVDPKEHMYAPKYMLENFTRYRYLLENPYKQMPRQNEI